MTLRVRIAAVAALAVAAVVLLSAAIVCVTMRSALRGEVDDALASRARALVHLAAEFGGGQPGGWPPRLRTRPEAATFFRGSESYVQFIRPDGATATSLPIPKRARVLARNGGEPFFIDMRVKGTHLRVLAAPLPFGGAVQVSRPLTEVDRELRQIVTVMVIVATGGVALGAGLGALVARAALAPIARFTRRTEALTADPDLTQRMDTGGRDELARLAASFNTTLDALERSVEAQRQLVADASHELRTPIASVRANVQVLQDADRLPAAERDTLRADILCELDELTALVGDIMALARGTKPGEPLDDVRLDWIVESVLRRARRRAADSIQFRVRVEPTVVTGEAEQIDRAVRNLVDNALKWSPARGLVDIELTDGTLSVRDRGPGFDPNDLGHVFERFYRAERARGMPGSGLGLAIVRHAAQAHGGGVEATNAPGGGALLRVYFGPPLEVANAVLAKQPDADPAKRD